MAAHPIWYLVPDGIVQYIAKRGLYCPLTGCALSLSKGHRRKDRLTATDHALDLTRVAADAAADKLGTDLVAYDVSDQLAITDVFLVITAANERQVGAVVDGIEEALRESTTPSRYAARATASSAGCCWTTSISSCTCSTPTSVSSTRSSGCGTTARGSICGVDERR